MYIICENWAKNIEFETNVPLGKNAHSKSMYQVWGKLHICNYIVKYEFSNGSGNQLTMN